MYTSINSYYSELFMVSSLPGKQNDYWKKKNLGKITIYFLSKLRVQPAGLPLLLKTFKLSSSAIQLLLKFSIYKKYNLYFDSEELGFSASFHWDLDGGTQYIRHIYIVSGKGQLPLLPVLVAIMQCHSMLWTTLIHSFPLCLVLP